MGIRRRLVDLVRARVEDRRLDPPPPPPAVSSARGGADPDTGEVRYLALGDSLSAGVGAPAGGAFPALLAQRWRARGASVALENPAVTRYTAADVLRDEVPHVESFAPTLVTLQVGSNDVATNVPLATFRANVRAILAATKGRVLVLPQNEWFRSPRGRTLGRELAERRAAFDAVLREETTARGAEWIDLRLLFRQQANARMWSDDGIHPTPEAYVEWADELARVVPIP